MKPGGRQRKCIARLRAGYEKVPFQRLLTITVVSVITVVFVTFSLLVLRVTEEKIQENVRDNMSMVLGQHEIYLGNYMTTVYNGLKEIELNANVVQLQASDSDEKNRNYNAKNYVQVNKLLNQFLAANSTCVSHVYINFDNGRVKTQSYGQDPLKIFYSYQTWKGYFPENQYYWIDAEEYRELIPDPEVGVVLFHLYETPGSEHNGVILIGMKKSFFEKILSVTDLNQDAGFSLMIGNGIMSFGNEDAEEFVKEHQEYLYQNTARNVTGELLDDYYVMSTRMSQTDWNLIYLVKEESISNVHYIMRETLLMTALTMVIVGILIVLISRAVSYPLNVLTKRVQAPDVLDREISISSYAEIISLSHGLEDMRQRINQLLNRVQLEEEQKHQIEIALMQEQINPHFLYNTLNAIMQLCEMNQPEKASQMLEALSAFYRIGLSKGNNFITVEEELNHVRNYLLIQHFRYSDLFDYTIDCEPEILSCRIPKMSLQPLVENAIYHGIRMKHGFGNICILGGVHDGRTAYLEVHDDGPGITPEKLREIRADLQNRSIGARFGMKNVDSRIKFAFGKEMGIELCSEPNDTCVRIRFRMELLHEAEEDIRNVR